MGKYEHYLKDGDSVMLPPSFDAEFKLFISDFKKRYKDIIIELVKSNRPNRYLICCYPKLDASIATVFAVIDKVSSRKIKYRTIDDNDWTDVTNKDVFESCLGALFSNGTANSLQLELMEKQNDLQEYEGIFVTGEPYEIDSCSLRVLFSKDQCENLLSSINTSEVDKEYDVTNIKISEKDEYPPTLKKYDESIKYQFFTLQGYLFEPCNQPFKKNEDNTLNFKIRYKSNMRM